ncbi:MAG TPA: TMEM175 family protein [Hanamia sp.]|nr:TMEM175 family protein [Hanamia sp.]
MNVPISHETKKEFQLERMVLFSDAVFAIAITLLIIDLKIPDIPPPVTGQELSKSVIFLIPKFVGFILSFFIIGLYWTIHHRIFGFVIGYSNKLVWLNLIFLFGIVLMPFSTAFYSEYLLEYLKLPVIFYTINISFLGVMNYIIWKYISNPRNHLTENLPPILPQYYSFRALAVPVIFMIMLALYLYFPTYAVFIPPLIPLIMFFISKYYKRKMSRFPGKPKRRF